MIRCKRVGLNLTKRCNWTCKHCFYRWKVDFNTKYDLPVEDMKQEIYQAKKRGCDHVVAVGWGETTLYPNLDEMILYSEMLGMTSSIITNGMAPITEYQRLYDIGLNHVHLSSHGIGSVLDQITGCEVASNRQHELMEWLRKSGNPWRANITMQQDNFKIIPETTQNLIDHGCKHIILLGFLPHYEWIDKTKEVAVHPSELKPYIQKAVDLCISNERFVTVRYHPFCHLDHGYWKYVVNAKYVLYDPWEWDYGNAGLSDEAFKEQADNMGSSVACGFPCNQCALLQQCGGWNRIYAETYDGAELKKFDASGILDLGYNLHDVGTIGFFHNQNPINQMKGYF